MYGILGYAEIFGMDGEEVCVSERVREGWVGK